MLFPAIGQGIRGDAEQPRDERHAAPLMVTECMLPALWSRLASADAPHESHREHSRPLEHLASHAARTPRNVRVVRVVRVVRGEPK